MISKIRGDEIKINGKLPDDILKGALLNICTNDVTSYTHGFHKFPAKFIPQIPRWAIGKYLSNKKACLIIDPFAGSGTTLVEGLLAGHNVVGIDIDKLACLIAKIKTTPLKEKRLEEFFKYVKSRVHHVKPNDVKFPIKCETIEHWFTPEIIPMLSHIRNTIDSTKTHFGASPENRNIYDLLLVCFSSILRRVSNADNESQKTYVSHTKIKVPEEPIPLFLKQLEYFKERIIYFSKHINPELKREVINTNLIKNSSLIDNLEGRADLAITSPPYIKAIDYIYNQMVELFWVGDRLGLETQEKQNRYKPEYIGTKQIPKEEYASYDPRNNKVGIKELDALIIKVFHEDKKNGHKHAYIVYRYFVEMHNHFKIMKKVLKKKGHYIFVVGDSTVSNISFPSGNLFKIIAQEHGFKFVNLWGYKIKNRFMRFDRKGRGGIIHFDWVLDFER